MAAPANESLTSWSVSPPRRADMVENRDKLRTLLRRLVKKSAYKRAARLLDATRVIQKQGLSVYRTLRTAASPGEVRRTLKLRGYGSGIAFRPGTADVSALIQNLIREEYGRLSKDFRPEWIVDAGAYIGDVSLYFLNRFPSARVVALEPSAANYALAQVNLEPYGDRARLLNRGLWSQSCTLNIAGEFTGAHLSSTDTGGERIECVNVSQLMSSLSLPRIDILKLDIEGAETEVLLVNSDEWLAKTRMVIVEFHGAKIAAACTARLHGAGFKGYRYRNLNYFSRAIAG